VDAHAGIHRPAARDARRLARNATTSAQRSVAGSLGALPILATAAGIQAPALIVVGEVARSQPRLQWFHPSQREVATGVTETT
jgi:siroheme synthase